MLVSLAAAARFMSWPISHQLSISTLVDTEKLSGRGP